jgi:5'-deoxynucleotidase YfbR-like HD superfamily hydrolase
MAKATAADPELLLVARTSYISLIALGEAQEESEYIDRMFHDHAWDAMNRAFYLEYFRDVDYAPGLDLAHEDELQEFPNTFRVLLADLTQAAATGRRDPLRDVEFYTLLSLAQHRHQAGKLSDQYRTAILALMKAMERPAVAPRAETMTRYVGMMRRTLEAERFGIGCIAQELLRLKVQERQGWTKRHLDGRVESVADHSYGVWLLGMIYLPEEAPSIKGFDKREILDMVLVHDLAEAYMGDLLPDQRTQGKLREEKDWYGYIGALSTFSGIGDLERVRKLWEAFENRTTENAKIARDLDRLECLTQLYLYSAESRSLTDAGDLEAALLNDIQHPLTLDILRCIQAHFVKRDDH